jgi:MFS family permease
MVAITNLLDMAYATVLVPVWAKDTGGGATAVGMLFASFSAAAVLGSVVAATVAERLPRYTTYLVAFLLVGAPRFIVLALDLPIAAVLTVAVVGGFATGFINPILSAVIFERIPAPLLGRVTSLNTSLCWALIPFGGVAGGVTVTALGLAPALAVFGAAYFAATMLPALLPQWREIDRPPGEDALDRFNPGSGNGKPAQPSGTPADGGSSPRR